MKHSTNKYNFYCEITSDFSQYLLYSDCNNTIFLFWISLPLWMGMIIRYPTTVLEALSYGKHIKSHDKSIIIFVLHM
jgi:hypothetical protein